MEAWWSGGVGGRGGIVGLRLEGVGVLCIHVLVGLGKIWIGEDLLALGYMGYVAEIEHIGLAWVQVYEHLHW
jgi:hypothetical protein